MWSMAAAPLEFFFFPRIKSQGKSPVPTDYLCIYTADPTWDDIFEFCFKAQTSKLERLLSLKRGERDVRALIFETAFEHVTPSGIDCNTSSHVSIRRVTLCNGICNSSMCSFIMSHTRTSRFTYVLVTSHVTSHMNAPFHLLQRNIFSAASAEPHVTHVNKSSHLDISRVTRHVTHACVVSPCATAHILSGIFSFLMPHT